MKEPYKVRPGGLMRCCEASLQEFMAEAQAPPKEGDRTSCKYCRDGLMIFRAGAWEWDQEKQRW